MVPIADRTADPRTFGKDSFQSSDPARRGRAGPEAIRTRQFAGRAQGRRRAERRLEPTAFLFPKMEQEVLHSCSAGHNSPSALVSRSRWTQPHRFMLNLRPPRPVLRRLTPPPLRSADDQHEKLNPHVRTMDSSEKGRRTTRLRSTIGPFAISNLIPRLIE
jgi:hypothetical protein